MGRRSVPRSPRRKAAIHYRWCPHFALRLAGVGMSVLEWGGL